jgi:hypothetical protein
MTIIRTASALALAATLGLSLAACADEAGGEPDAVASIDDSASSADDGSDDGDDDGGGGGGRPDSSEFRDAALEYAQCMRDNGIDMPDPTFDSDGGGGRVMIGGEPEAGTTGPSEEFEAADEECRPILEEAAPEMQLTPEEQAEMQDRLVAMAECMRARGHDMPDPQVGEGGGVTIGGGPGAPLGGGPGDDEFRQDMEECGDEAGMDGPRFETRGGDEEEDE